MVQAAIQGLFEEVIAWAAETTRGTVPRRSVGQLVLGEACNFEAFYQARIPPPAIEPPLLIASVDGKGMPTVKTPLAVQVVRRAKHKKAPQKKLAMVATDYYTQQPRVRTPRADPY